MRQEPGGSLVYSPSDLVVFGASPFASWMDRLRATRRDGSAPAPDAESADLKLVARMGDAHEQAELARRRAAGPVLVIEGRGEEAFAATKRAFEEGPATIFQAALEHGPFRGFADFLERVERPSRLGAYSYEIVDTKLARSPKPYFLIQLCAYAEMLEAAQGVRPASVHVVLGTNERRTFRTDDFYFVYESVKRAFLDFMKSFDPARPPDPDLSANHGRWQSHAERWAEERDHLSRVAGIARGQIRKLEAARITTVAALAVAPPERVPNLDDAVRDRLRAQARLQKAAALLPVDAPPPFELIPQDLEDPRRGLALLPPAIPGDVYADFEGYPLMVGGLEYLFGATIEEGGKLAFREWWAHDRDEERVAFEGFVDFLTERRRVDPSMHVFHYAPYETTALKRLAGSHGTREEALDALLRGGVFVDLYQVVRQGVRVGASSYSIKKVERLYRPARVGAVATGGESIVAYHAFIESGEPRDWRRSKALEQIRDYNRDDCDSTFELAKWLRERQPEAGIAWMPLAAPPRADEEEEASAVQVAGERKARDERAALAAELLQAIPADPVVRAAEADRWRIQELLARLIEFHRREEKPVWWARFERAAKTHAELVEDADCLGDLRLASRTPVAVKRSTGWRYTFDREQETKLRAGSDVLFAHQMNVGGSLAELDGARGTLLLKLGSKAFERLGTELPPDVLSIGPDDLVNADALARSIAETALKWRNEGEASSALADLILRRPPRIEGHDGGPLLRAGEGLCEGSVRVVRGLRRSTLCVQGPPGAGKTHTGAEMILALLADGKRVGVMANSHKAVENLLAKCLELSRAKLAVLKVGGDPWELAGVRAGARHEKNSGVAAASIESFRLFGGTAWFFSRPDIAGRFNHLFVDEAGQVSLANIVAASAAAENLVLLGDQMQLGQPTQGVHPGDSGLSALEFLLEGRATIPPELGLFLAETWRMHPAVCSFISGAIYEDRLKPRADTARRVIRVPQGGGGRIPVEAGVVYVPVAHDGNAQASTEEAAVVRELYDALIGRAKTGKDGGPDGVVGPDDVLVVAPYNLQVATLRDALPPGARVGSVDLFQGQEAAAVIVSMGASDVESSPRGFDFLFDRRRLNVAISRAKSLAIVVGSPALARPRCTSVEQLRLANVYCRATLG